MNKLISRTLLFSFAVALFYSCSSGDGKKEAGLLMIGIAEVNYTPPIGTDLEGNYRGSDYASRGVHDSLFCRAIVASNGIEKVAILTIDICYLKKNAVNAMRANITEKTGIKAQNIMVSCSHTHSGPKAEIEDSKAKEFLLKASTAAIIANERLKPTTIAVGKSTENRISHNRRIKCKDGSTHMCWEKYEPGFAIGPLGPIDPEVITMSFTQDGKQIGALVNFACHATTLTGNNWLYTADYPGYMVESIKKLKGKDYLAMFMNGTCGNITQVDYRVGFPDTYQECQRIGYMLGVSAVEAINNEQVIGGNEIAVSHEMVPIGLLDISDEQLEWAKMIMKKVEKEGMPPIQADGIPDAVYAKDWIEMRAKQDQIDSLEVMVVRISDAAFVALPGEMFTEFGLYIKEKSPCKNTIVTGLSNDSREYFPTKVAFTEGLPGFTPMIKGYETTPGSTRYDIGAGETLSESALNQLNKLFSK